MLLVVLSFLWFRALVVDVSALAFVTAAPPFLHQVSHPDRGHFHCNVPKLIADQNASMVRTANCCSEKQVRNGCQAVTRHRAETNCGSTGFAPHQDTGSRHRNATGSTRLKRLADEIKETHRMQHTRNGAFAKQLAVFNPSLCQQSQRRSPEIQTTRGDRSHTVQGRFAAWWTLTTAKAQVTPVVRVMETKTQRGKFHNGVLQTAKRSHVQYAETPTRPTHISGLEEWQQGRVGTRRALASA